MCTKKSKRDNTFIILVTIVLQSSSSVTSMTLENQNKLFKFLENDYNPYIRPVSNQSFPVIVDIKLTLYTILSYDEKTGTLSSLIYMQLGWQDEFISSSNFPMVENDMIPLPSSLVWSPRIYLFNTATEHLVLRTGETKFQTIFLDFNGRMHHTMIGLAVTKCDANSFYYPRDEHKCEISITSDEAQDKIILKSAPAQNGDDTSVVFENGNWEVSEVYQITLDNSYTSSILKLSFKISRTSMYPIVNLVIPLACLCMLNSFVFALPESSGERISYSLTMLLALILYLNMLADRLPTTGPISLININIVVQFTTSCFVVVLSILSLRMHENEQKNKPVPRSWKVVYRIMHTLCCIKYRRNSRVNPGEFKENPTTIEVSEEERSSRETVRTEEDVSWHELSMYTNKFFFGTAVTMPLLQTFIFFLYVFRVV